MDVRPNRIPAISSELADLIACGDDSALLKIISDERLRNVVWANAALMELHKRHSPSFLFPLCKRLCSQYLRNESDARDMLHRLLWRIFGRAERFDPVKAKCQGDQSRVKTAVRSWMAQEAKWLAREIVRLPALVKGFIQKGGIDIEEHEASKIDNEASEPSERVRKALVKLSHDQRFVILAKFFFTDMSSGGPIPPNEAIDTFCARRLNKTAPYIRQLRSRALKALREHMSEKDSRIARSR
jgi:DNA-directed RNA polymerase specialized sigma24 family protein